MTFIAALLVDRIDAPCVLDGPVNAKAFQTYVEHFLIPTLAPGDVVVMDKLASHKNVTLTFVWVMVLEADTVMRGQAVPPGRPHGLAETVGRAGDPARGVSGPNGSRDVPLPGRMTADDTAVFGGWLRFRGMLRDINRLSDLRNTVGIFRRFALSPGHPAW